MSNHTAEHDPAEIHESRPRRLLTIELRRLPAEHGIALVMALGTLLVLSIAGATVMTYTSANLRSAHYGVARVHVRTAAEAGLNDAFSILNNPNNNALDSTLLPSRTVTIDGATVTFSGVFSTSTATWAVTSSASQANPAGGSNVTSTLTASVLVVATLSQPFNAHSYDYIMSTGTGNTCDMTIADGGNTGNPAIVNSRLFVFGNLCIGTSSGGQGQITGAPLQVKGKLTINNSSSSVGSSSTPIGGAHIAGACKYLTNASHTPCTGTDHVWSNPAPDTTVANVAAPTADFAYWYTNAEPGPSHPCTTTSGTPPTWDNDGTRNNSVSTSFELTPASSYTCLVGPSSSPTGELAWNASTKTLTVLGTMYIDGSAKITNGALNQYTGEGTLYLSGTFYENGSKLCAAVSGSNCDWPSWDPNSKLFGIVAEGTGGQVPAGVSVHIYNSQFEGAIYGTGKVRPEGTTQTDGPLVGSEVELGYNANQSAAVANGFPLLTTVPVGLPGVPNVHATPQAPAYGPG